MNADEGFTALGRYADELTSYCSEDLTESDTRAKFIDFFLRDILGWQERNIRREKTYWDEGEKAALDYEVGFVKPLIVVEAKRRRTGFELPRKGSRFLCPLDGVIQSHPNIWSAVSQTRRYCDDNGIPYGLATNGEQFALFRAITFNRPWKRGNAAVFDVGSLRNKHFAEVYAALSAECCTPDTLDELLGLTRRICESRRLADTVGVQVGRLTNKMTDVVEQTIAEVLRDQPEPTRDFLLQCYTVDSSTKYYAKSLRSLLRDPIPIFASDANKARPGHKRDPFARAIRATLGREDIRPPVLLVGGKGCGKTTFLNWFLKVSPFTGFMDQTIVLWLDFRGPAYSASEASERVRADLANQLENRAGLGIGSFNALKEVFKEQIADARSKVLAPYEGDERLLNQRISDLIVEWRKDGHAFLGTLVRYAIGHCKKRVLIVLDNADQKEVSFQYAVHDVAQQLASSFPVTIILSLRESTFYRLSKSPRSDAFSQQQVYHIQSPSLPRVIRQRFDYLAQKLQDEDISFTSAAGFSLTVQHVQAFVSLLKRSLLEGKHAADIMEVLTAVSNGSVREALNLIHEFLVSGHTKMEEYFWEYAKNTTSFIPFHEFLASVLLGEMAFFTEQNSHVFLNLYTRSPSAGDSHFFRLRVLAVVEALSSGSFYRPEDFVPIGELKNQFREIGAAEAAIDYHLQTLIRFGLLLPNTQSNLSDEGTLSADYDEISSLHMTPAGKYYLDTLCCRFQYIYRIIPDIPFLDKGFYDRIEAIYQPFRAKKLLLPLESAADAVGVAVEYLTEEEKREQESGILARNSTLDRLRFSVRIREGIEAEMRQIDAALRLHSIE